MSTHHNYTKVDTVCPECHSSHIWKDNHRQETYCNHCGLILTDTQIFSIISEIQKEYDKNRRLNDFWRRTNKKKRGSLRG